MNRILAATAIIAFGLAPSIGAACEYMDDSRASATPEQIGAAQPMPAASKVPAPGIAKSTAPTPAKPVAVKAKAPAPDQTIAATSTN